MEGEYAKLIDYTNARKCPVLALDINARDFKALEIRGDLSITATARPSSALKGFQRRVQNLLGGSADGAQTRTPSPVIWRAGLARR